jgi:hypothetical protein
MHRRPESQRLRHASVLLAAISAGHNDSCEARCPDYFVDVIALPYCGLPFYGIGPGGLSANGDITGAYNTCGGDAGAFYWTQGALTLFDVEPDALGVGWGINSKLTSS